MTRPDEHSETIGAAVRRAAAEVRAPAALHERVATGPRPRRRARALGLLGAVAAAAALAVVLLMAGGPAPTVARVAEAALDVPTRAAPAPGAGVEGVAFPDWETRWGWRAVGARTDVVDGRRAVTVIYRRGSQGAHYTIVAGTPLPGPDGARTVRRDGRAYSVVRDGDAAVVAWEQGGRTCVLASTLVDEAALLRLASWR